jgi:hypothetical protein
VRDRTKTVSQMHGFLLELGISLPRGLAIMKRLASVSTEHELTIKGASWAFAIGVGLCLLIYGKNFFKGENDGTFSKDLKAADAKSVSTDAVETKRLKEEAVVDWFVFSA